MRIVKLNRVLKRCAAVLLASSLASGVEARPPQPAAMQTRVTRDFDDVELTEVVRYLGQAMGREVYLGPGIKGRLKVSLRQVPAEAALREVLASFSPAVGFKLIGEDELVVAAPDCKLVGMDEGRRQPDDLRREFLLERAPAAKVIGTLQPHYEWVEFIPHPTMNGFYAVGKTSDLQEIADSIPELDVIAPVVREFVQVKYGDLEDLRPLYDSTIPEVRLDVDTRQSTLILEGSPDALEEAQKLLAQLDEPIEPVELECKLLRLNQEGRGYLGVDWETRGLRGEQRENGRISPEPLALHVGTFKQSQTLIPFQPPAGGATQVNSGRAFLGDKFPVIRFDPQSGKCHRCPEELGLKLIVISTGETDGDGIHWMLHGEFTLLEDLLADRYPVKRTVTFDGTVNLQNDQAIVIDGLLTPQDAQQAVTAVPLLADLPALGYLFQDIQKGESTYLVLTPNVMK